MANTLTSKERANYPACLIPARRGLLYAGGGQTQGGQGTASAKAALSDAL
jgi:hypothetical protein